MIIESNQFKYSGKGPLDAKSLLKTYAELLLPETWQVEVNGRKLNGAYNGLITAVWLNKSDPSKNGVYYLHDPAVTSVLGIPDVTNESNWHKVAGIEDVSDLIVKIANNAKAITDEVIARAAAVAEIYKPGEGDAPATGLLAEEINRATEAERKIADSVAALIGSDQNKSVREIAIEEIARIIDTGDKTVSAYIADQIAILVQPKESNEISVAEDGTLGIREVSTDKLVQGTKTLVFNGGCSKYGI